MVSYNLEQELQEFGLDYKIPTLDELKMLSGKIPEDWFFIFESTTSQKINMAISLWSPFEEYLPDFVQLLRSTVVGVEAVIFDGVVNLVYVLDVKDSIYLYCGSNPKQRAVRSNMSDLYERLPLKLKQFYLELFDGFGFVVDSVYGPLPSRSLFKISEADWSNMDHYEDYPFGVDPDNTVAFYTDEEVFFAVEMNDYSDADDMPECIVWPQKEIPYKAPLWNVLDKNMVESLIA